MSRNYEEMSDFEINKSVGILINKIVFTDLDTVYLDGDTEFDFNPCKNPSDAWPIIVSNEIDIIHNGIGCALATDNAIDLIKGSDGVIFFQDENPLRAAMICFLMMKDGEQ